MIKVIFIEEHMFNLLDEVDCPMSYILEFKPYKELYGSATIKKDTYIEELEKLISKIGKYDFENMLKVDAVLNKVVFKDTRRHSLMEKIPSIHYNRINIDNDVMNQIHNQLLSSKEDINFKGTYNIIMTIEGNFMVIVKEGFTNFVNNMDKSNKLTLLDEIINLLPKNVLFGGDGVALLNSYKKLLPCD